MFGLGLEFSLRKLAKVGATAFVAATAQIIVLIWVGYEIGRFFNWTPMDSIFCRCIISGGTGQKSEVRSQKAEDCIDAPLRTEHQ